MTRNEFMQHAAIAMRSNGRGHIEAWNDATQLADAAPPGAFDAVRSAPAASGASGGASGPIVGPLPTTLPGYGRANGEPITGASREDLHYYIAGCRKSLSDESKSRWHGKERAMLAALEAELAKPSARQDDPPEPAQRALPDDMDSGVPF